MHRVEVAQPNRRHKLWVALRDGDELDENVQVLLRFIVIPVELQKFDSATQSSAALFNRIQHPSRRHRTIDWAEDTPFGGSIDLVLDFGWQLVAEVAVDELSISLWTSIISMFTICTSSGVCPYIVIGHISSRQT